MIERIQYDLIRNDLQTGDMVFFSGRGLVSKGIKIATGSEWSHVGLVIRIDVLDLVLIWESTTLSDVNDIVSGEAVRGVQIAPLSRRIATYDGDYAFRRMGIPNKFPNYESTLKQLRRELDNKPYEQSTIQLIKSAFEFMDKPTDSEDLSSVFCSELVAEYYQRLGILDDTPSCLYSPADLATQDYF